NVVLALQEDARAACEDQRVLAEERPDRLDDRAALVGFADVERVGAEVGAVAAELQRLAHSADGAVEFEDGRRRASLGKPPPGGHPGGARAENDDWQIALHYVTRSRSPRKLASLVKPSSNEIRGTKPNRSAIVVSAERNSMYSSVMPSWRTPMSAPVRRT